MYYLYVLISKKDNNLYIGYSHNLKERISTHMKGKVSSTANRRPLELIYYEAHYSQTDALRREQYFKTSKGKSSLQQMLRDSLKAQGYKKLLS
ncbi:MAG: hypothetical protein A3C02_02355 [Candidatus Andersenbacteria bacterium RIFCSPHIGHO2_02_FULL_45_11]|nr:MAG: hypothetical protein A2805_01785 [Candidatus Andersenbacteria bacterium RIFCSPHIGHO2_01_FULL_46_36]OGY34738.1 MAG: hypothetical protein A3C02_02355 [Candidatus Andersenbacteria bacterium RIFCSPHIGHO2_02_FULL_45_11]